jgi:hypothetical protein
VNIEHAHREQFMVQRGSVEINTRTFQTEINVYDYAAVVGKQNRK